ncbi:MAG: response regulator receiver sensor signal transduction histidine kinase [Planctomycetaceae bacterium]|nr:response regulator receiver sensor signal transduction histidine kinase [Planctomycetaceae bacterium]
MTVKVENERVRMTILIINAQPANQQYLVTLLENWGHRLLNATDGVEGIAVAVAELPDLIIADFEMSTMDGGEFVRRLRAEPAIESIPVVFDTAKQPWEQQVLSQSSGFLHVLTKLCEVEREAQQRPPAEHALEQYAARMQALSRRLVEVQEEERRHLARELHDEFGQILATITLHLHAARGLAGESAHSGLDECAKLLRDAGEQVRNLSLELRPTMLDTHGLEATLNWLAEKHRYRNGWVVQVSGHISSEMRSPNVEIACFRVAQEALTNVVRHAAARQVWIELRQSDEALELIVRDDGRGFDMALVQEQAVRRGCLGLLGMAERVQLLGGVLYVESVLGVGTQVRTSFPLSGAIELSEKMED